MRGLSSPVTLLLAYISLLLSICAAAPSREQVQPRTYARAKRAQLSFVSTVPYVVARGEDVQISWRAADSETDTKTTNARASEGDIDVRTAVPAQRRTDRLAARQENKGVGKSAKIGLAVGLSIGVAVALLVMWYCAWAPDKLKKKNRSGDMEHGEVVVLDERAGAKDRV
ncbi:hypothetical protein EJ05DRAFT_498112 [Pseudovirgaria hyperparasitica]|uniref:Mid2 domain-containing protein n=1 Tax=Pseudovirgaria hyperparasitica TaxID=470096 RepID=A0A6A6WBD0_9PEZI|nr:uncharacterized protein EJ05DRAFT_498112 [Pseudovirgaria hyperparasitica]KAF2760142.1 hypothetical protein EJ05DRAFT_498112 [Pseudovirgaria hyperparasitica]